MAGTLRCKELILEGQLTFGDKWSAQLGQLYLQLPGESDPDVLFYGTWENISSSFAGDFLRIEGGDASGFDSGEQSDAFQEHAHEPDDGMVGFLQRNGTGGGSGSNSWYNKDRTGPAIEPTVGGYGTPRTSTETRPVNQTIRVWRRIL